MDSDSTFNTIDDKYIPTHALDALSFIFEGTIDRMRYHFFKIYSYLFSSIKSLRDVLLDPLCISNVGYDKVLCI